MDRFTTKKVTQVICITWLVILMGFSVFSYINNSIKRTNNLEALIEESDKLSYYRYAKVVALKYKLVLQMTDSKSLDLARSSTKDYIDKRLYQSIFLNLSDKTVFPSNLVVDVHSIKGTYNDTNDLVFKMNVTIKNNVMRKDSIYLIRVVNGKIYEVERV